MFAKSLLFCSALMASSAKSALDAVMAAAPSEEMQGLLREHSRSLLATSCEYMGNNFIDNDGLYNATSSEGNKYNLSICKPLSGTCKGNPGTFAIPGACMCQNTNNTGRGTNRTRENVVIASWTAEPLPTWEESADGNPQLKFQNGAKKCYIEGVSHFKATLYVEFVREGTPGDLTVEEKNEGCTYVAKFSAGGIPVPAVPSTNPSSSGGLSDGSIFIIVFGVSLILYCVIGVFWRKTKIGSTGEGLIPNHEFWCGLPGLVKDGCNYVVAKTCMRGKGAIQSSDYDSI